MLIRKCRVCGSQYEKKRMGQVVCSPLCAVKYMREQKLKKARAQEAKERKAAREKTAATKRRLETVAGLTKKAQAAFNRYVRLRDAGKPCISCGRPLCGEANSCDAGHYRSIGAASHLRFDENNVHGQCKQCNRYLSGNAVAYRAGLIERIGLAAVEALEADNAPRKWSKEELRELEKAYKAKAKELERGG